MTDDDDEPLPAPQPHISTPSPYLKEVNPFMKRMRRAYGLCSRSQNLRYFVEAPEGVQLRIRRAEMLILEAMDEYEPFWMRLRARILADKLATSGDFNHPDAQDSPLLRPKTGKRKRRRA